jgi:hypothetical protein
MTKRSNDKKTLADPGATHLELRFYPYADETQAVMVVARGLGDRCNRLRVWSGVLPCGRGDLRGMGSGEVALMLTGLLRDALASADGDAVAPTADSESGEATGAPLGAIGGTVIQPELDFTP